MGQMLEHPKYGLNETQPVCFFCLKPRPYYAFLGGFISQEAPPRMNLDYDSCPNCAPSHEGYVLLIECSGTPTFDAQPKIDGLDEPFPTGRYLKMINKRETLCSTFAVEAVDFLLKEGRAYLGQAAFARVLDIYHVPGSGEKTADPVGVQA